MMWFRRKIVLSDMAHRIDEAANFARDAVYSYGDSVRDHPVVAERPELSRLADKAMKQMCAVYLAIDGLGR